MGTEEVDSESGKEKLKRIPKNDPESRLKKTTQESDLYKKVDKK
jgi:hypothetical protein